MRRDNLEKFATLSCVNAKYNHLPQLTLTLNCQTVMWWPNLNDWKRNLCQRWPSNNLLEPNEYSINLPQCINNSIRTSNYDANTNLNNQYEMRRDDLNKFATLSRVNAKYNYLPHLLSHYYCLTKMWWPNLDDWKRNLAREGCPTIDLILM